MRLIDADALMRRFMYKRAEYYHASYIVGEINTAPTIDAVPVVRCKDCRYSDDYYNDGCCYCKYSEHEMRYIGTDWNWYCAGGERRDDQRSENIVDNGKI